MLLIGYLRIPYPSFAQRVGEGSRAKFTMRNLIAYVIHDVSSRGGFRFYACGKCCL